MILNILCVAFGGALGASLRYVISLVPVKAVFPFQTFFTNILGCFAVGVIAALASGAVQKADGQISPALILFLKTGFCGGFTTFSTFALESAGLFSGGHASAGGVYVALTLVSGIICVCLGQLAGGFVLGK
ncbi:fluoride efflux transporter FluC [Treponema sp.]|uniref:fluoride efflux transporter FluC n=1 Tax=Treponema sp. TaxID=166 RepID=UPI003EFBEAEC